MVKASPRPVSSLIVQLRYLLHIPLMGANPMEHKGQKNIEQYRNKIKEEGILYMCIYPPPLGKCGSHLHLLRYEMGSPWAITERALSVGRWGLLPLRGKQCRAL